MQTCTLRLHQQAAVAVLIVCTILLLAFARVVSALKRSQALIHDDLSNLHVELVACPADSTLSSDDLS